MWRCEEEDEPGQDAPKFCQWCRMTVMTDRVVILLTYKGIFLVLQFYLESRVSLQWRYKSTDGFTSYRYVIFHIKQTQEDLTTTENVQCFQDFRFFSRWSSNDFVIQQAAAFYWLDLSGNSILARFKCINNQHMMLWWLYVHQNGCKKYSEISDRL